VQSSQGKTCWTFISGSQNWQFQYHFKPRDANNVRTSATSMISYGPRALISVQEFMASQKQFVAKLEMNKAALIIFN